MQGLELARRFYEQFGAPMLHEQFAAFEEVALVKLRVLRHLFLVGKAGELFLNIGLVGRERLRHFGAVQQCAVDLQQIEIQDDDAHCVHR